MRVRVMWFLLGALTAPSLAFAQDAPDGLLHLDLASIPAIEEAAPPKPQASGPGNVTRMMNWVTSTRDNHELPYIIIDKTGGMLFVFDSRGLLLGMSPVLLGSAIGDDSAPGVGDRELRNIPPEERTTPAGRFVAKYGPASGNKQVLWVDFSTAVSIHAVITGNARERRLERLESETPEDNRITFGCINLPTRFYNETVKPLFSGAGGIVYVIPETRDLKDVFLSFSDPKVFGPHR